MLLMIFASPGNYKFLASERRGLSQPFSLLLFDPLPEKYSTPYGLQYSYLPSALFLPGGLFRASHRETALGFLFPGSFPKDGRL